MNAREKSVQFEAACRDAFPAMFVKKEPVPLALGIREQLLAAFPDVERPTLHRFMQFWTSQLAYLKAMSAKGAVRHNLDGTDAGPVSDEHREFAEKAGRETAERVRK